METIPITPALLHWAGSNVWFHHKKPVQLTLFHLQNSTAPVCSLSGELSALLTISRQQHYIKSTFCLSKHQLL